LPRVGNAGLGAHQVQPGQLPLDDIPRVRRQGGEIWPWTQARALDCQRLFHAKHLVPDYPERESVIHWPPELGMKDEDRVSVLDLDPRVGSGY
jgi:hypothetical protein